MTGGGKAAENIKYLQGNVADRNGALAEVILSPKPGHSTPRGITKLHFGCLSLFPLPALLLLPHFS